MPASSCSRPSWITVRRSHQWKDSSHRYIFANREVAGLYNLSTQSVIGKTPYELYEKEERSYKIIEADMEVLTKHVAVERTECHTIDGVDRYWFVLRFPIIDAAGNVLIGTKGIEITRQKQAEQALQEAHDKLELRV